MAKQRTMLTRIQTKRDTAANWELNNPILLNGEQIIVDTNAGEVRMKIGDGTKTYSQLPFTDELLRTQISTKVTAVDGKGLSTNDYTTTEKNKLAGIAEGANKTTVDTALSTTSTNPVQNKVINTALGNKANSSDLTSHTGNTTVHITAAERTAWNAKASTAVATTSANGLMSSTDKTKLDGIEEGANKYTHPATHAASIITQDATHRFVSDTEKNTWNAKASTAVVTTSANGLMISTDKSKLDGIEEGANKYTHPATHPATMITEDANNRFVTDTQISTWNAKASTAIATVDSNGLMSAADKTKLANIEEGANKTVVDSALSSTSTNPVQNKAVNTALAGKANTVHTHTKSQITDFPTSMPASDVSAWAKAATKPTYSASEVGADAAGSANTALTNAKSYTDEKISDLINSAPTTLDTLGEIATAMQNNEEVVEALNTAIGTKANSSDLTSHTGNTTVHITASERSTWNAKASTAVATTSANGLMSKDDKTKLDGIATGANNYTHPTYTARNSGLYKITVDTTGHVSAATAVAKADITALGIPAQDTTYSVATTSANGLMSSTDKTKLDGIATGANNYTHPTYTAKASGLYKVTVDGTGHVSATTAVAKADITALGIPAQDTTYSNMTAATSSAAGTAGLVPAPAAGKQLSFLRGDGTWVVPTNTTYSVATTSANGLMSSTDKTNLNSLLTQMTALQTKVTQLETDQASMLAKLKTAVFVG